MRVLICLPLLALALAEEPIHDRATVQDDLVLTLNLEGEARIVVGDRETPRFHLGLRNDSEETTYPIVLPGDGSEVGWREPAVGWVIEFRADPDAEWTALEQAYGRCGLYDQRWQDDVVSVAPGDHASDEAWSWIAQPWAFARPDRPGTCRIRAVYEFARGRSKGGGEGEAEDLGAMAAMPAFVLRSEAIEIEVVAAEED